MSVTSQSSSPLESSGAESPCSSEAPPAFGVAEGAEVILFESYLYKMPPLKKSLLMKWSKRWFTLRKKDVSDLESIELCYYKDGAKKEKKTVIDLSKITGIRPTPKIGSSDHIFAIETEEKKYILKAADHNTKNIWLAKLCEYCGQETVYHVTVPYQPPVTTYNEAILKLSSTNDVMIVLPSTSEQLLSIQFGDIRRMGYMDTYSTDVIWFETCKNSRSDRFFFFIVPSGFETAKQVLQELKTAIQTHTASLLILEDSSSVDISYIARQHYGCAEFSTEARNQILQSGLHRLPPLSWRSFVTSERVRRESASHPPSSSLENSIGGGVSLEEWGRRKNTKISRGPPPASMTRRPTLDKFVRQTSVSSFDRQASVSSFDRQASISSFDRSLLSTPSLDRDMTSPSLHELGDGHSSSGSGSDVFESPFSSNTTVHRNLSLQTSMSSQGSSNGSILHSHALMEEKTDERFSFDAVATHQGRSFSCSGISGPTVPPRSVVSLQHDASYFTNKMAAAH